MPRVQQKRGTASALASVNPTPLAGELVWDSTENAIKIGDGSTAWSSLAYVTATPRSGSVTTATIADDAVTYAKLQNVSATDRLLGRSSAGAGNVEEIACTAFGRSLIDDADAAAGRTTLGAAPAASPTFTGTVTVPGLTSTGVILADDAATANSVVYSFDGDPNTGIGRGGADILTVVTNGSEHLRVDSSGRLLHGITSSSSANVFLNKTFIGSGGLGTQLRVGGGITASSGVATDATLCRCVITVTANSGTPYSLNQVIGVRVEGSSIHADATVTEQIGFYITSLSGAANNRAFRLGVPTSDTSTNHNIYADGTAPSYFRGNVGIGNAVTAPSSALQVNGVITVSATSGSAGSYAPSLTISGDDNTGFGQVSGQSDTASIFTAGHERLRVDSAGRLGVATASPTAKLDVNADTLRLRTARTPASASAAGNAGDICWDASYLYVCTATNTWRRIAHDTW